jgi:hypothetical protein
VETRAAFRSVPSRPIALALAVLAVLALALTAWSVLGAGGPAVNRVNDRPVVKMERTPQYCGDPYSVHDAICAPSSDPYSPRDPLN